jgi:glycosyltransferase involved in cell wall biosynthesis
MSSVLFYDPVCPRPYDTRTLRTEAMGGSEAMLVRVADALGALVMQHNRTEDWERYRRPRRLAGVTHVIVNRDSRALATVRERYPRARTYLWLHDRLEPGSTRARWLTGTTALLREMGVTVVCVSDWQRRGVERLLRELGLAGQVRALTIYNAVDDELEPDGTPVDAGKLVFFSAPGKGIRYTLDAFDAVRERMPDLRLVVGNPGYRPDMVTRHGGVEFLGAVPQARIHAEVRSALCTFYPNFVFQETFGLVFAESHALGTPVLTHDCGAAPEVVGDPGQVLPVSPAQRLYEALARGLPPRPRRLAARLAARAGLFRVYLEHIRAWRDGGRPHTGPDPRFRLSAVADRWRALLPA